MKSSSQKHTYFMIGSIVAAFAFSWMAPEMAKHTKVGGEIFLRCLMMVVVPLVMTSVMSGILGLGDVRKLGKPGGAAVLFYVTTTVLAVLTGVLMFNLIQPGQGVIPDLGALDHGSHAEQMAVVEETSQQKKGMADIFENLLLMLFTENLLQSMVEIELLPLIVFSIIFAGLLTTLGKRIKVVSDLVLASNDALLNFVMLLMKFAPVGIFCLVASNFGEAFAEGTFVSTIKNLASYMVVVLGGLFFHFGVTLPLFLWFKTRRNPYRFMAHMSDALLTAFSTASSSATLPVTMECAEKKAHISRKSIDFVLPLGATINMDGTALYEAAAALFIANLYAVSPEAQAVGFELTMTTQVVIAVTATMAAIGAAGIPEAGLVTMAIVLGAVGLPVEYMAIILPVDWFLDRFRTMINAFGDSVGAAIVDEVFTVGKQKA
ncbi:MAG: dicarboxylate/amino acid:cation symporter [Verrucomicrobia bacterium]|jgi:Na+/H+-dicarboxylate symporter|nr:dicarboxylate/amino acid:cation symporter [Verrucomicrobiota bacterium]MBT6804273.1 dicarboxylate/amino acid:cation symporter [Verrucomicrobiota bacterium]MBT7872817.1 dicarboxylate/amino acid:cation symporter [Verrucomicrobiota bacterium]